MNKLKYLLILAIFCLTISCDENDDADDHDDDHLEPHIWEFYEDGNLIFTYDPDNNIDPLVLDDDKSSGLIEVAFKDDDGDIVEPGSNEYSLDWSIDDQSIIEFNATNNPFNIQYTISTLGTTNVYFRLMHGDHADITAQAIELQVK